MFPFTRGHYILHSKSQKLIDRGPKLVLGMKNIHRGPRFNTFRAAFYGLLILNILAVSLILTVSRFEMRIKSSIATKAYLLNAWQKLTFLVPHDHDVVFALDKDFEFYKWWNDGH